MILYCERCGDVPPLPKGRYCNNCKLQVIKDARNAGKIRDIPKGIFSDERGRTGQRSSQVLGGAPRPSSDE